MKILKIYTDGSYKPKHNIGAYSFVIITPEGKEIEKAKVVTVSSDRVHLTNNKMEMMAVIKALNYIRSTGLSSKSIRVYIYTDSQYVQLGWDEWLYNWKQNGWLTSNNKKVKNKGLWLSLDNLLQSVDNEFASVHIQWMEGHDGNKYNERADELCNEIIKEYLKTKLNEDNR